MWAAEKKTLRLIIAKNDTCERLVSVQMHVVYKQPAFLLVISVQNVSVVDSVHFHCWFLPEHSSNLGQIPYGHILSYMSPDASSCTTCPENTSLADMPSSIV